MSAETALIDFESKKGTEVHLGAWLPITQERVNQFAEATEDKQWIHVDERRASAESPYGGTIAHGFLTLSLIPYLTDMVLEDSTIYPDAKLVVNYGLNKVRFPQSVLVGSQVRCRVQLEDVQTVKDSLQIVQKMTIEIEGVEKPACVAEMVIRAYY